MLMSTLRGPDGPSRNASVYKSFGGITWPDWDKCNTSVKQNIHISTLIQKL